MRDVGRKRGFVPKALRDAPRLLEDDLRYYELFMVLNRGRRGGMNGPDPLQVSEILSLADGVEIANLSQRGKYLSLMQEMDRIWLQHAADVLKSKAKTKT